MKQSQGYASIIMNEQNRESIKYITTVKHGSAWYSWNQWWWISYFPLSCNANGLWPDTVMSPNVRSQLYWCLETLCSVFINTDANYLYRSIVFSIHFFFCHYDLMHYVKSCCLFTEQEFAKSIMRAADAAKSCVAQQVKCVRVCTKCSYLATLLKHI